MGLLAVCSAKGSPGASTLAVALAALWPTTAVLADLDPAGSDLLWRNRAQDGAPLDPDRGLLSLGAAVRRAGDVRLLDHTQVLLGGMPVLAGVTNPDQVTGLGPVWPALTKALATCPDDVVADCGRIVPGSPTMTVLARAGVVLLVVRPGVETFAQLRERLRGLASPLRLGQPGAVATSVVVVADDGDSRSVDDLQRLLDAERLQVPVIGRVALDPRGAAGLHGHWDHRVGRSLLVRSVRALVPDLAAEVQARAAA